MARKAWGPGRIPARWRRAVSDSFDVLHYDLRLAVDFPTETIQGRVTVTGRSVVALQDTVLLDLTTDLTVTGVERAGVPLEFAHEGDVLAIALDHPFAMGETWSVEVSYEGPPRHAGADGMRFAFHGDGVPIVSTLSEPWYARWWWPCKDVPDDKATVDLWVTVPDTMVVASNGELVEVLPGSWKAPSAGSGADAAGVLTYHWSESYPISTYLVSVAATNYEVLEDEYVTAAQDTVPVLHFVYPEKVTEAQEDFSVTVPMMEAFAGLFGEYPFVAEKYGHALFPWGGAMEHQTCTTYGDVLVQGNHTYDWVVAHELAHQWWGDLVTLGTWADIWLNEGFASYSEALWVETQGGFWALHDYMQGMDYGEFPGSIYDPDQLFNATVYKKGAWALHMLRHVVGDTTFFAILRDWAVTYAYDNATTADFQALCEAHYGASLGWFFQEWVYGTRRPHYEVWWEPVAETEEIRLVVNQIQTDTGLFTMPVDVGIVSLAGDTAVAVVWDSLETQEFLLPAQGPVVEVLFDPYDWILKDLTVLPGPSEIPGGDGLSAVRLEGPWPNPVRGSATLRFYVPGQTQVDLSLFEAGGRFVARLMRGTVGEGWHTLSWPPRAPLASGCFLLRLEVRDGAGRSVVRARKILRLGSR
jgi:aminopeptidase N